MYNRSNRFWNDKVKYYGLWGLVITLAIVAMYLLVNVAGKLALIISYNYVFWALLGIGAVISLYRKFKNPDDFTWGEFVINMVICVVATFFVFLLCYSTAADIDDQEIWNGYVTKASYYEGWTERVYYQECASRDKNGNCTAYVTRSYDQYHPPYWQAETSIPGFIFRISRAQYRKYVGLWGHEQEKNLMRGSQVSIGDGDQYYVTHHGGRETLIPASEMRNYVNYLRGSDSIRKTRGSAEQYKDLLLDYPTVRGGPWGPVEVDRVLDAGVNLPKDWVRAVDRELDLALATLGATKEVNILIYVVKTGDEAFAYGLKDHWVEGKKNDVIVVIGTTNFPTIDWVHVIAWTKVEEFKVGLRNDLQDMGSMANAGALSGKIIEWVGKDPNAGGFARMPMSELEYLIADISLPWWAQGIIFVVVGGIIWGTTQFFIRQETGI